MTQFKIGDWVINDNANVSKVIKDHSPFETEKTGQCIMTNSTNGCYISANKFELWKPIEGEFVIPKQTNGKAGTYISGFSVCMWTNDDVYECEPFIGELPSFLKE